MKFDPDRPSILVLFNASDRLVKGEPRDMLAEQGVIACAQAVAEALSAAGYRVESIPLRGDLEPTLAPFPPTEWAIFNLAEGLEGRLFEEARLAWALEAMGYRFTGSGGDALLLASHKARAKKALAKRGIATPPWRVFRGPDEVGTALPAELSFPVMVKPVAEGGSIGIDAASVVESLAALGERVAYIAERYRQMALAEAFIAGRELNIALWGEPPEALPLAEVDFTRISDPHHRIVSYAAKWETESLEYRQTPILCPAKVPAELAASLKWIAQAAWGAIGCRGYARVDIRLSPEGTPFVLEVNPNPDLSPDAGFANAARAAGFSYQDTVVRILELALKEAPDRD